MTSTHNCRRPRALRGLRRLASRNHDKTTGFESLDKNREHPHVLVSVRGRAVPHGGGAECDSYRLHVPPNPPVTQFWSITLCDVSTRALIDNNTEITDRSSRQDLVKNADGSVDLYFGPRAPQGFEQNWIPTLAGKAWFPYFRLYGPTEAHFDRSWILPNIEKAR